MICPHCGHDNLEGADNCETCLHDLRTLDVPLPTAGLQKHLMEDRVSQIPFDRLVLASPDDSVAEVVSRLKAINVGQAVVVEEGKLVGIMTERDLLYKVAGRELDLQKLPVREVMTPHPEAVREQDEIRFVINKMSVGGYRHVPIVRDDRPVGIISAKAIANYILEHSELEF